MIREAVEADLAAIAAITNHYITTTAIHFAYEPVTVDDLATLWRGRDRHVWLVDDRDGRIVGYAKSGTWRERSAYAWTCELGVYIAYDVRGGGVGTGLYRALLDELPKRGFHSAVAGITLPNPASIKLHQRFGFTHVGTFVDAGFKLDAWHAVDWWQLRFA
jgi:phosphinothricin acetyltransferase